MQIHPMSANVPPNQQQTVKSRSGNVIQEKVDKGILEEVRQTNQIRLEVNVEEIHKAIDQFNKVFRPTYLNFQLHDDSGKYFVRIIDDKTQEVIRQIPSDDFLHMAAEARGQQGLIIDERV
ncbi:flagellar protein FlaG [Bacillus sp. B15-48]|uniref:flagellar protein FlaG n=1 Tax=Bacillus sp. B15-48 TaxID=1548601 RepID=UPI00193F0985|nr:flagellar protein FlaG [Bacillus sp. B15-48]MBM4764124.1 hypothetical protein [Bacillus sp. B15-48]